MVVPFTRFMTKKWAVLASKIDKLFIVIGMMKDQNGAKLSAIFKVV